MNIFIICPVRNVSDEVRRRIELYVETLERKGYHVYYPARDTDQTDQVGLNICLANLTEIRMAAEVHIWYDPESQGSIFDLGALVMSSLTIGPKKRVVLINRHEVLPTNGKSFTNVVLALAEQSA